ncbi:hypothetical protein A3Q40_03102 [Rhodococcus sp. PBTS 1]|nr:hypothetical protein A3Q40_03102 [Rhodococcus sp. PBTS 1]
MTRSRHLFVAVLFAAAASVGFLTGAGAVASWCFVGASVVFVIRGARTQE